MESSLTANNIDARAAHFEREENFRWLSSLLATTAPQPLRERVSAATEQDVYSFAEFAEISHGSLDPAWILAEQNRRHLGTEGSPLENYPTLTGAVDGSLEPIELADKFYGTRGDLQGYCALRMSPRTPSVELQELQSNREPSRPQIILAFSGTSNARLALYDVMVAPLAYKTPFNHPLKQEWRVHDGFQRVYRGIRVAAFKALKQAITSMEAKLADRNQRDWDLIITSHSLGAAVSYLILLDILHVGMCPDGLDPLVPVLPTTTRVTIATFGSPRVGNPSIVSHYRQLVEEWRRKHGTDSLTEWSVIGHMDGVPALPPTFFGYAHFSGSPYYSYGGHLYPISTEQSEYTNFKVEMSPEEPVLFARGGHNYYGARDMERLQRRLKAIFSDIERASPIPTRVPSSPSPSSLRSKRSISDGENRFGNKRIWELSNLPKHRAASLPSRENASQTSTMPEVLDGGVDPEASALLPTDVPVESPPEGHENSWIQRYIEREKAEEAIWVKKNTPRSLWGTLKGVAAFGILKRA